MSRYAGLKVAISGAQGTGKTTLARVISEITGLPLIGEVAREVAQKFGILRDGHMTSGPMDELTEGMFQQEIRTRQRELEHEHRETGFVADRSCIDHVAYALWKGGRRIMPEAELRDYMCDAAKWIREYDRIYFVRPFHGDDEPVPDDGFRSTSKPYQEGIDLIIRALLLAWAREEQGQPQIWVQVDHTVLADRVRFVLNDLDELARRKAWPKAVGSAPSPFSWSVSG